MTITEVHEFLKQNGYILEVGEKLVITGKYQRDLATPPTTSIVPVTKTSTDLVADSPDKVISNKEMYKLFIQKAQVPSKITSTNGSWFWANRYSVDGERVFTRILKNPKIDKVKLLQATYLYYKSNAMGKPAIGNFFAKGLWESCYEDFIAQHDKGNLAQHVQNTLKEGNGENKYEQSI